MYVRGGGQDENLIILDDATLYNPTHLGGLFSTFNGDAIKATQVYKGGFPARYGGRLSSIIDVSMKEGNKEEYHGKVGIGLLSSQAMLEGPIQKGKSSFLLSGRRSYFDLLARLFTAGIKGTGGYFFHDFNGKVNYEFSERDKVYLSAYYGLDKAFYSYDTIFDDEEFEFGTGWGNLTATLRWNHQYNEKLFANTSLIYSNYRFFIDSAFSVLDESVTARYLSAIDTYTIKEDVDYFPSPRHSVKMGGITHLYTFNPNSLDIDSSLSDDFEYKDAYRVFEGALYVEDEIKVTSKLRANVGLRGSFFRHENTNYGALEPRLLLSYHLPNYFSVKGSYTRMNQYIHLLTNSTVTLPTDLWRSSTALVPPRKSHQVALGVAKDFVESGITITVEGYYKRANNILSYREGAVISDRPASSAQWDTQVNTDAVGDAYGTEFFFRKDGEKLTTWLGYTLAWNINQSPSLNNGKPFYPKYDRRHDVSFVLAYKPDENTTLSCAWVYGTGVNYTLQRYRGRLVDVSHTDAQDGDEDTTRPNVHQKRDRRAIFPERFNLRGEPTHRLDLGFQRHKQRRSRGRKKKKGRITWDFSIYNAYNRKNPFFYTPTPRSSTVLSRWGLFPLIPSVSYRYEF